MRLFESVTVILTIRIFSIIQALALPSSIGSYSGQGNSLENGVDHFKESSQLPEKCKKGTAYKISHIEDLLDYKSGKECIFRAGLEVNKPPEGPMHGLPLNIGGYDISSQFYRSIWSGKITEKILCNGTETYIGWNKVLLGNHFPFITTNENMGQVMALNPLEFNDGRRSVIIDYSRDLRPVCPDFDSMLEKNKDKVIFQRSPWSRTFFPLMHVVDVIRFVGRQKDGGAIYLGKLFFKDMYRSDQRATSLLWFAVVNYDIEVNTEFKIGDSLPPLETDSYYIEHGVLDMLKNVVVLDNIMTEPIHSVKVLAMDIVASYPGLLNMFKDLIIGSSTESRKVNALFGLHKPFSSSEKWNRTSSSYFLSNHNGIDHSHFNEL